MSCAYALVFVITPATVSWTSQQTPGPQEAAAALHPEQLRAVGAVDLSLSFVLAYPCTHLLLV
jgi:hypothetical protein